MAKNRHHHIENIIYERTKQQMNGAVTKGNFSVWEKKWFETAEALKNEFEAEGLTKSAGYVDDVIAFNKKCTIKPANKNDSETYRFASGWTAKREYGVVMSPQQQVDIMAMGKWVLRDQDGIVRDVDKYRSDMFERHPECEMFDLSVSLKVMA